jgi:hypothetical protein
MNPSVFHRLEVEAASQERGAKATDLAARRQAPPLATYDTARVDPTNRSQWHAAIDGDIVVWLDQRDWPLGSHFDPNNPEVHMKNSRTGVVQRITHDLAPNPVTQDDPVVEGDWIA